MTGANTGLGQAIAVGLATRRRGHRCRRTLAIRRETAAAVQATGGAATAISADLGTKPDYTAIVAEVVADLRTLRHPGQQRRHHPPRRCARVQRGRLGRRDGRQHQGGFFLAQAAARHDAGAMARAARSSTSRRCCRSRAASASLRTPRARAASRASRGCWPTNGRRAASTSMRSRRATSPPTTRGAARGRSAQPRHPRAHPGRALGRAVGPCGCRGLPGLVSVRLRARRDHPRGRRLARSLTR